MTNCGRTENLGARRSESSFCIRARSTLSAVAVLVCLLGGPATLAAAPAAGDPVLAVAGPDTLLRRTFQIQLAVQGVGDLTPENIQPLIENWVNGALIYREALRLGLGSDETTQAAIREYERQYLINLMSRRITDTVQATDNEIFDYYNRRRLDFVTRLRFAYMALSDEPSARQAIRELNAGKNFKTIAAARSLDRASNPEAEAILNGRNDTTAGLDPVLEDTVFTLPLGKLIPPIKSSGAWWLVKPLDRTQLRDTVTIEQVRDFISKLLELKRRRGLLEQAVAALRKRAKVISGPSRGDTSGVLAAVNGSVLTRHYLSLELADKSRLDDKDLPYLLDVWTKSELLYQEARRLNLGSDETTQVVLTGKRRQYLTDMMIERTVGSVSIPSTEAFDYFQQNKDDFLYDVKIEHILCGSDSLARLIAAALKQGVDFSALARATTVRSTRDRNRAIWSGWTANSTSVPCWRKSYSACRSAAPATWSTPRKATGSSGSPIARRCATKSCSTRRKPRSPRFSSAGNRNSFSKPCSTT